MATSISAPSALRCQWVSPRWARSSAARCPTSRGRRGHGQELVPAVAVMLHGGVVDRDDAVGLRRGPTWERGWRENSSWNDAWRFLRSCCGARSCAAASSRAVRSFSSSLRTFNACSRKNSSACAMTPISSCRSPSWIGRVEVAGGDDGHAALQAGHRPGDRDGGHQGEADACEEGDRVDSAADRRREAPRRDRAFRPWRFWRRRERSPPDRPISCRTSDLRSSITSGVMIAAVGCRRAGSARGPSSP